MINLRCGEPGCPGGHTDLTIQHCNPRQLIDKQPVIVPIAVAVRRPENCPKCGHRSFFRKCKCGAMLW